MMMKKFGSTVILGSLAVLVIVAYIVSRLYTAIINCAVLALTAVCIAAGAVVMAAAGVLYLLYVGCGLFKNALLDLE